MELSVWCGDKSESVINAHHPKIIAKRRCLWRERGKPGTSSQRMEPLSQDWLCNRQEQIWLYRRSVPFTLAFIFYVKDLNLSFHHWFCDCRQPPWDSCGRKHPPLNVSRTLSPSITRVWDFAHCYNSCPTQPSIPKLGRKQGKKLFLKKPKIKSAPWCTRSY